MLRKFSFLFLILVGFSALTAQPAHAAMTEKQKIEALLKTLDEPGITFIRNGESHDGAWGHQHLKEKLAKMKHVKTADAFISKVASTSSHTGKPYIIKLKDGTEMPAAEWFKHHLDQLK